MTSTTPSTPMTNPTGSEMWAQYRKTFLPMQAFILSVCALIKFGGHAPWPAVGFFFGMMQICSLLGARWAVRLRGKATKKDVDELPLNRRRP